MASKKIINPMGIENKWKKFSGLEKAYHFTSNS